MKNKIFILFLCVFVTSTFFSCTNNNTEESKKIVQKLLESALANDISSASSLMPMISTLEKEQQIMFWDFLQDLAQKQYILSVPETKGTVYTVSVSVQGEDNAIIHYNFETKKEDDESWTILETINQKITYDRIEISQ